MKNELKKEIPSQIEKKKETIHNKEDKKINKK